MRTRVLLTSVALALGVAAGAPSLAAAAPPPPGNLLHNPDAEVAPTPGIGGNYGAPSGWTVAIDGSPGNQGPYDSCYGGGTTGERLVVDRSVGDAIGGGARLFFAGQVTAATLTQDVTVTPADVAGKTLRIGGFFGGYEGQADDVTLAVHFLSAGGVDLGSSISTAPVTAAERHFVTSLLARSAAGVVPAGTTTLRAVLTQTRREGSDDDGYADNLYATFGASAPAPATPHGDANCPLVRSPVLPPSPPPPPVVVPSTPPVAVPPAKKPVKKKPAAKKKSAITTVVKGLPPTKRCVSRRHFRIRLRRPKGTKIVKATVRVNHKTVATRKGKRVTAPVDLRGLPKGRYTVRITVRLKNGKTIKGSRRYHTCAKKKHTAKKHTRKKR